MNAYNWIPLRSLFPQGVSTHTRENVTPQVQHFGSSGQWTCRRHTRQEASSRKRWLLFGSRHVRYAAIAFLILFLLNPAGAAAWFTAAEPCTDNFQLTKANHTTGTQKYSYKWKGTCFHPCAESNTYSSATVEAAYDGVKKEAAEEFTFTAGVPCKVQITMTGCLYNPFIDFPINGVPDGCGNRLVAVSGCDEAYSLVPDIGFMTEGMVPRNVTYSSGGSPPPPPPPRPPGAYEVKRIVSPAGEIASFEKEITLALEPRQNDWLPKRIKADWEESVQKKYASVAVEKEKVGVTYNKVDMPWSYKEAVPTDWDELPKKTRISWFPSEKKNYRVRVYAEGPNGEWSGPSEWSYFSFVEPKMEHQDQSIKTLQPQPPWSDLTVEDFIPWSQTSWQGKTGWRLRWKFKNIGEKVSLAPKYRIECDVIDGGGAYEAMCTEFERTGTLPGEYLFPDQTIESPTTNIVYEPDSDALFQLMITAVIDPENEIYEGALGEYNNVKVSYIGNIPWQAQVQEKLNFPLQTQASSQYTSEKDTVMTGKEKMKKNPLVKSEGMAKKKGVAVKQEKKSNMAAVKGHSVRQAQVPIILGLGSNKAFDIGETIALQIINANEGLKGKVERYDGRRWVPFKEATVRSRGKSGQSVKWEIKIKKQGEYRLRVGDKLSKTFAVKKDTVKMATASVKPKMVSGAPKPKQVVKKRTASAKKAPTKPSVRLKKNTFTVGDKITINAKRVSNCTLLCELQIKRGNNYKTVKKSETPIFTVDKKGDYRVVASCKEGGPHSELFFDVRPKLQQQKVTKKKTNQTPAMQKQPKQRKMHQVAQQVSPQ